MASAKTAAKKPATTLSKDSATAASTKQAANAKNAASAKVTAKAATRKPTAPSSARPAANQATSQAAKPRAKASGSARTPSRAQRHKMIEEAAYFLAEKNFFAGHSVDYWVAAEAQIDAMLA